MLLWIKFGNRSGDTQAKGVLLIPSYPGTLPDGVDPAGDVLQDPPGA